MVLNRLSDVTYRIQRTPRTKPKVVQNNRLKRYQGEDPPQWLEPENNESIHDVPDHFVDSLPTIEEHDESLLQDEELKEGTKDVMDMCSNADQLDIDTNSQEVTVDINTEGSEGTDDEYEVEDVLKFRKRKNGGVEYFLKWKGFPQSEGTWQTKEDMNEVLQKFVEDHEIPRSRRGRPQTNKSRSNTHNTSPQQALY